MNKDVIYIDVEDDITAIIGKIKSSQHKIIALVPPKRVGVLQSAVNLRLLLRSVEQHNKHLVLITGNGALSALAAAAKIPVAKNLQSKPEIPQIAALEIDDGDDIIDGSQLSIGDHASATFAGKKALRDDAIIDSTIAAGTAELNSKKALPPLPGQLPPKPKAKSGIKVPNFGDFRKRLIIGAGAGIALIIFLVWALVYAPSATVIITARTTDSVSSSKVSLNGVGPTSLAASTIQSVSQQAKKDVSISFDATGTKDVGEKSTGQIVFKNCETMTPQSIPAGTTVSANGRNYVTSTDAAVTAGTGGFGGCTTPGTSGPIAITATDIGDDYNTPSGTTFSAAGHPSGSTGVYFKATATTNIDGGSKKQIKIVSDSDIQKAADQLTAQDSTAIKKQLTTQFGVNVSVLDQSFKADQSAVKPAPASGQESTDGKAKLSGSITYTMVGVAKTELKKYLDSYFAKKIEDDTKQRVYDDGADTATLSDFASSDSGATATLAATAQIGPKIDDAQIKETAKGKRYGDIQAAIESIPGVEDVDTKFSPFWVKSAPNDVKRISVQFKLNASR